MLLLCLNSVILFATAFKTKIRLPKSNIINTVLNCSIHLNQVDEDVKSEYI